MKYTRRMRSTQILLLLLLTIWGCQPISSCNETLEFPVKARLSLWKDGAPADTVLKRVSAATIRPGDTDSALVDTTALSILYFYLNPASASTAFTISNDTLTDTLTLYYQTQTTFISYECGLAWSFTLQSASSTNHLIDSIGIVLPETSITPESDEEHIRIYF